MRPELQKLWLSNPVNSMDVCIVAGKLVTCHQDIGFNASSLRILYKLGSDGQRLGKPFVALDRIGVDDGQIVLIETAMEATMGLGKVCAADAAIIAIVDKF